MSATGSLFLSCSALTFVERGLGVCVMDPISINSYCSYAQPGKIVFRRLEPEIFLKFGILYPADSPRSMITIAFAEQLRNRILELKQHPEQLLAWGEPIAQI